MNSLCEKLHRIGLLLEKVDRIGLLLEENGCDCNCGHVSEDGHDESCERCLACRIDRVLTEVVNEATVEAKPDCCCTCHEQQQVKRPTCMILDDP